jgi:hypothetical protein
MLHHHVGCSVGPDDHVDRAARLRNPLNETEQVEKHAIAAPVQRVIGPRRQLGTCSNVPLACLAKYINKRREAIF